MKISYIPTFLFILAIFWGCSKQEAKIDGQVFVVTKGSDNVKLGLVEIFVCDPKSTISEMEPAIIIAQNGLAILDSNMAELNGKIDSLKNIFNNFQIVLKGKKEKADLAFNDFKNHIGTNHQLLYSYMYDDKRDEYYAFQNKSAKIESEILEIEIKYLHKKLEKLTFLNDDFLFSYSPLTFIKKVKSDADGKFQLVLNQNDDYAIFAKTNRLVGDKLEKYVWYFWYKPTGPEQQLFLSNDNLFSSLDSTNVLGIYNSKIKINRAPLETALKVV